jgi:hypothetical protein
MRVMNVPRAAARIAEIIGAPLDVMNDADELAALEAADQQAQEAALMLEAAPAAGKAAKDFAQAGQIAQGGGAATLLRGIGG